MNPKKKVYKKTDFMNVTLDTLYDWLEISYKKLQSEEGQKIIKNSFNVYQENKKINI